MTPLPQPYLNLTSISATNQPQPQYQTKKIKKENQKIEISDNECYQSI